MLKSSNTKTIKALLIVIFVIAKFISLFIMQKATGHLSYDLIILINSVAIALDSIYFGILFSKQ